MARRHGLRCGDRPEELTREAQRPQTKPRRTGPGSANVTAAAEFNCYVDPEAAAEVLHGVRCPLFMSGLDVTNRFTVDAGLAAELDAIPGAAAGLVADVARRYLATYGDYANAVPAPPLHDPVALFVITQPELFDVVATEIVVELAGAHTRGATVAWCARPARPPRRRARTGSATSTPWRRAGCCLPRAGSVPALWVHPCVTPQFTDARPRLTVPRAFAIPRTFAARPTAGGPGCGGRGQVPARYGVSRSAT